MRGQCKRWREVKIVNFGAEARALTRVNLWKITFPLQAWGRKLYSFSYSYYETLPPERLSRS